MLTIKIGNKVIGENHPCFIIAEAGVNHNGDIKLAKKLVDIAVEAGADAVKFQTFHAEALVTATAEKAAYQQETTGSGTQFEMLKKLELGEDNFKELAQYAKNRNIIFLSTPFDTGSVDLLARLGVPAFKIPSGEINNFALLKYIARRQKPIILSTGMSTLNEVAEAVKFLKKEGATDIVLLHCVTSYPARVEDTNLKAMETMRRRFKLPVGLSDHTTGIYVPIAAVALGACVIEKHFTIDRNMSGPDHRASLEPAELKEMVQAIRDVTKALGDGLKRPAGAEEAIKKIARRSLVAKVDIPAGTVITGDMLEVKRPGTGIEPKHIDTVIGKKTTEMIKAGEVLTPPKIK
jgi:N-acetylneuraminate synthase/N,N'-diacetyllegionaminate synthase